MRSSPGRALTKVLSRSRLVVAALALLALPALTLEPHAGLDPSWQVGLALAAHNGLHHGNQIDFTYGPLGFLAVPIGLTRLQPFAALIFAFGVGVCFFAFLTRFLRRWLSGVELIGVAIALALAWGSYSGLPEEAVIAYALAVLWFLPQPEREGPPPYWVFALAGFLGTLQLLVKFGSGVAACVLAVLLALAWPSRLRHLAVVAVGGLSGLVGLWVASGQSLRDLGTWLQRSTALASGYTDMAVTPTVGLLGRAALFVFPSAAALTLGVVLWRRRNGARCYPSLLAVGISTAFLLKQGLVRFDGHFLVLLPGLATLALAAPWRGRERWVPLVAAAASVALVLPLTGHSLPRVLSRGAHTLVHNRKIAAASLYGILRSTVDNRFRDTRLAQARNDVRGAYGIPAEVLAPLEKLRVHAEPWDVSAIWAYGLSWRPTPVFQSYSAYTQSLDQINARMLMASDGPSGILQSPFAIDGRYWLWESPAAQVSIACSFTTVASGFGAEKSQDGKGPRLWEALIRTEDACAEPHQVSELTVKPGAVVQVPQPSSPDRLVTVSFDLSRSAVDEAIGLVARPVRFPFVQFDDDVSYRLVIGTAPEPHLLKVPARVGGRAVPQGPIDHRTLRVLDTQGQVTIRFAEIAIHSSG